MRGEKRRYIWQRQAWPTFEWDADALLEPLATARHKQGRLLGRMAQVGFELRLQSEVSAITEEAVKSSAIEGEVLDPRSVRSSLARRLGLAEAGAAGPPDRRVEGVVELMLDATQRHAEPLSVVRLGRWHHALFPIGYSGLRPIVVGRFRNDSTGPMQVVSGPEGRHRVHFEAPPAKQLKAEVKAFLAWFNEPPRLDGLLRAGLAHLWFVTLHPFDDGNGRMARAITDMALAQDEDEPQRFYSVSSQIRADRDAYYRVLEETQRGELDVTRWLRWFLDCFGRAIDAAEAAAGEVLGRAAFWQRSAQEHFSERQKKVLNRFLAGFEGKLTAKKWAALGKCSIDTAQRDINDLVRRGLLVRNPGGSKNTSYSLPEPR